MLTRWYDVYPTFAVFDRLMREMEQALRLPVEMAAAPVVSGPRANLYESRDKLVLQMEVPGLSEEDLDISLVKNVLTISGERKDDTPEGYSVHRKERAAYKFTRSFELPYRVDPSKIEAVLENGVLTLEMPRHPEEQARVIKVKTK